MRQASAQWSLAFAMVAVWGLFACSGGSSAGSSEPIIDTDDDFLPAPVAGGVAPAFSSTWQWQLDGELNLDYPVDLYDLDLDAVSDGVYDRLRQQGVYLVCYFSAGSYEAFRADEAEFNAPRDAQGRVTGAGGDVGRPLDAPFGEERWLDIRSANVWRIMESRLDRAAARGCDAVEPDNVDAYSNDNGLDLSAEDQRRYNRFIANAAHARGLAVGLKNDLDQISALVDYFDFAVNEQCHQYAECEAYAPFLTAEKPVFNAEYASRYRNNTDGARDAMCAQAREQGLQTLVLAIELDDRYRYSCDP